MSAEDKNENGEGNGTPPPKAPTAAEEKNYQTFKGMMTRFLSEKTEEEEKAPKRTESAKEKPKTADFFSSLFGGN